MIAVGFAVLAAAGAIGRWQFGRLNRADWPAGTLSVNVAAAFVLGLLHEAADGTITVLGVGLLGSLSTFSTVVRELVDTTERRPVAAATYLTVTVVLGVAAAWVGVELS
ncbi:MAG: CrcB family protein [Actinomycetota bacterium]